MKVFAVVLLLITVFGRINSMPRGDQNLADQIRNLITEFFDDLPDKEEIKDLDLKSVPNFLIYGEFDISELSIAGYKNYSIDNLVYDESSSRLDFAFTFEDILIALETQLTLDGVVDIKNSFCLHIELANLTIEGYAVLAEDWQSLDDLSVSITLQRSNFDIKGFLNSDEISKLLSLIISMNLATVVNEASPNLTPILSDITKTIINIVLKYLVFDN